MAHKENDLQGKNEANRMGIIVVRRHATPCGELILGSYGDKLCLCDWALSVRRAQNKTSLMRNLNATMEEGETETIRRAIVALDEYFAGQMQTFDIPTLIVGTEFQRKAWAALLTIPYGETRSYGEMAHAVGSPRGARAVAQAIGANRLSIIIPCHRVVGADNALTGYAGGIEAKKTLLRLENSLR